MKKFATIIFVLICIQSFSQELEVIKAKKSEPLYETSIEAYKKSEMWGIWTMEIGKAFSTSVLSRQGSNDYSIKNLSDYDLNTAWIEGESDYGIGEKFGFVFSYPENAQYGSAYQFFGQVNLFNGYCKSLETWTENSRIKKLKVYYNDIPICLIELVDTWHFQHFDIGKFFKYKLAKRNMDAPYEIVEGDKLVFEIIDIYKGTKYSDVAISEFMAEGAGN